MTYQKNKLAVSMFSALMKFSTWLQKLPARMTPPPFRLVQLGSVFWQSRVLYVAARLDIATQLANDSLPVEEIARRVAAQPEATYRLLRMLTTMGILGASLASATRWKTT